MTNQNLSLGNVLETVLSHLKTKMAKINNLFTTKAAEKPYPSGPHIAKI